MSVTAVSWSTRDWVGMPIRWNIQRKTYRQTSRWWKMKVLFLQDVRPSARAGDVKEVKDGFARNYLLPQGHSVFATDH